MINDLHTFIKNLVQLSVEEKHAMNSILNERLIKRKEHLIVEGEVCKKLWFFNHGLFRYYHTRADGAEITSDFVFAPYFATSYTSLITGNPSFVNLQALEDMKLLEFSKDDLNQLYNKYSGIERLGRKMAELTVITSEKHLFFLLNQSAKQRYTDLIRTYPEYLKSIPLQYIASYLGITQETLSRIRKSI